MKKWEFWIKDESYDEFCGWFNRHTRRVQKGRYGVRREGEELNMVASDIACGGADMVNALVIEHNEEISS